MSKKTPEQYNNFNVKLEMKDKEGVEKDFYFSPTTYGVVKGGHELMNDKRHFFAILTGNVGDGKSNLATELSAIWEHLNGNSIGFENVVWSTAKFVEKTDREDNKRASVWWDEAIQGATGKKVAITKEGDMLKIALVTKRFKQHFYILVVDEIEEYAWKLIKMCNVWFHVHTRYGERGYYKVYWNKRKIKTIYNAFKFYKWDWDRIKIPADDHGRFRPYLQEFFDEREYDKRKLEETRQGEKEESKSVISPDIAMAVTMKLQGMNNVEIGKKLGKTRATIRDWVNKAEEAANSM